MSPEQKKEEDDPFGSGGRRQKTNLSDRRKKSHFKAASRNLDKQIQRAVSPCVLLRNFAVLTFRLLFPHL